jgi:hypothetical protein
MAVDRERRERRERQRRRNGFSPVAATVRAEPQNATGLRGSPKLQSCLTENAVATFVIGLQVPKQQRLRLVVVPHQQLRQVSQSTYTRHNGTVAATKDNDVIALSVPGVLDLALAN